MNGNVIVSCGHDAISVGKGDKIEAIDNVFYITKKPMIALWQWMQLYFHLRSINPRPDEFDVRERSTK